MASPPEFHMPEKLIVFTALSLKVRLPELGCTTLFRRTLLIKPDQLTVMVSAGLESSMVKMAGGTGTAWVTLGSRMAAHNPTMTTKFWCFFIKIWRVLI